MPKIDKLFHEMQKQGASDLHLSVGFPPVFRLRSDMIPLKMNPMTPDFLEKLLFEILREDQIELYREIRDIDFSHSVEGVGRFRGNIFQDQRGIGAVFRIIPTDIKSIEEMGYPEGVSKISSIRRGLVLVTGPTGSGKSTTLASIINEVNCTLDGHIITIEDPIEFVHPMKRCLITQREVHSHTKNFANALRAACREDPDVVLVGEMRDYETISLALSAAELGILVFGTLHTNGAAQTIDRIIDVFPTESQQQARSMLSDSLKAVIAQQLLRTMDGRGRCAVQEILMSGPGLNNLIREGKTAQIASFIQTGTSEGMQTMDQGLQHLVKTGKISREQAFERANNKKIFAESDSI